MSPPIPQTMDPDPSGNGTSCATCDVPPRIGRAEVSLMRVERDGIGLLAALQTLDVRLQARLTALDAAVAESYRVINEILTVVRLGR